jgi:hypothetical protein
VGFSNFLRDFKQSVMQQQSVINDQSKLQKIQEEDHTQVVKSIEDADSD